MNTSSPTPRPHEPLTPEERALAARLARIGPHGTPLPALDAKILGAAHAAAGRQARPGQRRWPALLGLAATLALAIGVTWQMRPTVDTVPRDEVPRASAPVAATAAAAGNSAPPPAATAKQATAPVAGTVPEQSGRMRVGGPATAAPSQAPAAAAAPDRAAASAISAPSAPPQPPAPQTAPAPAPPPPPLAAEQTGDSAAARQAQPDTMARREQDSRAQSNAEVTQKALGNAASPAAFPQDLATVPVARDSELAPADWLERVRLRRDAGDLVGARESLQLLRRAHPEVILPDDLRQLADSQIAPP